MNPEFDGLQRTPPRRRSAGRRVTPERITAILDAAQGICITEGYSGITMQTLATRTGMVRPVIYDCFGTVDNVIEQLAIRARTEVQEDIAALTATLADAAAGQQNPLSSLLIALTDAIERRPATWRFIAVSTLSASAAAQTVVEDLREEILALFRAAVTGSLHAAGSPADVDADVDVDAIALVLRGIVDTFIVRFGVDNGMRVRDFIESVTASMSFVP